MLTHNLGIMRPRTPRRIRAVMRPLGEHAVTRQQPTLTIQELRLSRYGGRLTPSGRTAAPGWDWVNVAHVPLHATIIVIERYWDSQDGVQRQHYGCSACHRPVHHLYYQLGDPHLCDPTPHVCGDLCRKLGLDKLTNGARP